VGQFIFLGLLSFGFILMQCGLGRKQFVVEKTAIWLKFSIPTQCLRIGDLELFYLVKLFIHPKKLER